MRWRPQPGITIKALGLLRKDNRILAAELIDCHGRVTGVRPLGGTVQFGECASTAVVREFAEDLGVVVTPLGQPLVMENIFEHEGMPGHEIVFIFELYCAVELPDLIKVCEEDGSCHTALWFDPIALDHPGGLRLFPRGLREKLV